MLTTIATRAASSLLPALSVGKLTKLFTTNASSQNNSKPNNSKQEAQATEGSKSHCLQLKEGYLDITDGDERPPSVIGILWRNNVEGVKALGELKGQVNEVDKKLIELDKNLTVKMNEETTKINDKINVEVNKLSDKIANVDSKVSALETKLSDKIANVDSKLVALDTRLSKEISKVGAKVDSVFYIATFVGFVITVVGGKAIYDFLQTPVLDTINPPATLPGNPPTTKTTRLEQFKKLLGM